jgi:carboxypeptidase D
VGRNNAAGVDLNRDFPDRLAENVRRVSPHRPQPETIAAAEWIKSHPFVLSANMHGGAVVASYPFDNSM